MENLKLYRLSFLDKLKATVPDNSSKYLDNTPWVSSVYPDESRDLQSNFQVKVLLDLKKPENEDKKDLENAILLHKALPNLTRMQARDPRLWTRLTHEDCWSYMRERWPVEKRGDNNVNGYIRERYFIHQSQTRALVRNGISRLWWIANATYDPARIDPYELTAVVLKNLDITQTILERAFGRAPKVVHGFLDFLSKNPELLTGGNKNRDAIRQLAKFLNMHGGFCILDCLEKDEIGTLLANELQILKS